MENVLTINSLKQKAEEAMKKALDYMYSHRCKSIWTDNPKGGWYEQWKDGVYSGLYATTAALTLFSFYYDQYSEMIQELVPELEYMFKESASTLPEEQQNKYVMIRKKRLNANQNITLKMIFHLYACLALQKNGANTSDHLNQIMEKNRRIVEAAFITETGMVQPAIKNENDSSVLTTAYAYILMSKQGCSQIIKPKTQPLFLSYICEYCDFAKREQNMSFPRNDTNKFERYRKKKDFVAALFALSNAIYTWRDDTNSVKNVTDAVFYSLNDKEIRSGFTIRETYRVNTDTDFTWETLLADSRLLYLDAILKLMISDILPFSLFELFMDDLEEIIDTIEEKSMYLSWDEAPTFSHHIRGLNVLHTLTEFLNIHESNNACFMKISPYIVQMEHRSIDRYSVVMFMSFSEGDATQISKNTVSSVEELLNEAGFNLWLSTNEPYDAAIMDRILDRMSQAQFIIVDCSGKKANVFYEAGLAHGLGKKVFLCSADQDEFPYDTTVNDNNLNNYRYEKTGKNYPYEDLQSALFEFIKDNINSFYMTEKEKTEVQKKLDDYWAKKEELRKL
ncbi:MAG: hypothetical protein E7424_06495 [Ruminococcaceae bacterium]|jgi:hypothetical protein|nr:hypothetical protein [Oscillospiraceae bacterium]